MRPSGSWRSRRSPRPRPWGPASSPAWRRASGTGWTTWPRRGGPGRGSNRAPPSTGRGGRRRSSGPAAGCPTCRRWTSRSFGTGAQRGGSPTRRAGATSGAGVLVELPRPAAARKAVAPLRRPGGRAIEASCRVPTEDRCVPEPADAPPPSGDRPLSRRLALRGLAALAGSAVAAAVASPALAQTATTGSAGTAGGAGTATSTTAPAPTTTAPPKRPTPADQGLLGFAQSLELASAQLYTQGIPSLSKDWQPIAAIFGRHHQAYGEQIGALLGRRAPGVANQTLLDQYGPKFSGGEQVILAAA